MRIIAGEHRGRILLSPQGSDVTRPITDRAKQSLFDILAPLIPDAVVFDLFCGTGSMGLECLSRGASMATFFDADQSALTRLRKNIQTLVVANRSSVVPGDLFAAIARRRPGVSERATIVFLDPPYSFVRDQQVDLQALAINLAAYHLAPGATVIFRHDSNDELPLSPLTLGDRRTYGKMAIDLLSVAENSQPG